MNRLVLITSQLWRPRKWALLFRRSRRQTSKPANMTHREAGLTLVELLVVLAILALFASLAVPQVLRYLGSARTETARTQINNLVSSVELYFLDVGRYPSSQNGLEALVTRPAGLARWNGPYLKKREGLIDPWGRPYTYESPGKNGEFDIFSLGRDGSPGGEGEDRDVVSW